MLEPTDQIFFNFVSSPLCTFISSFLSSLCSHLKTYPTLTQSEIIELTHLITLTRSTLILIFLSSLLCTLISVLTHLITLT